MPTPSRSLQRRHASTAHSDADLSFLDNGRAPRLRPDHASTAHFDADVAFLNNGRVPQLRPDHPPRNEEIKAFKVYMVRPEDNRLSEPILTFNALQSRRRDDKGRFLEFLQEVSPVNEREGQLFPVCKMFDKKAVRESQIAKRKASRESKKQTKQLDVGWKMADNDLSRRLGRFKEFLEKGLRVEISFERKRKRMEASQEDVQRVLERISQAAREAEGAREFQAVQGKEGQPVKLVYEGKAKN